MHDIEPFHKWRNNYIASEDVNSPFYGRTYSEFSFTNKIYNYFIHPQWDEFGSNTLYIKVLYVDYDEGFACVELLGEWNDCISNDIMYLKREIADSMFDYNISKFIIFCDNVLNFHGSDDCYYEEWAEDAIDSGGWVILVNTLDHVFTEMQSYKIHDYFHLGTQFNNFDWRNVQPKSIFQYMSSILQESPKSLF